MNFLWFRKMHLVIYFNCQISAVVCDNLLFAQFRHEGLTDVKTDEKCLEVSRSTS